jgi:hypothetical protein
MLKRIIAWVKTRRSRSSTPDDLEAQRAAKQIEDDLEMRSIQERQASSRLLGR